MLDIQLHIEKIKKAGITHPADVKAILAEMIEIKQEREEQCLQTRKTS